METAPYEALSMHRQMVGDRVRCEAYRDALAAVVKPGATVLDVGAGTGILSMFAAQAGAGKVYAVERTSIAELSARLVHANGLADRVEVIRGDMHEVELPESVDVIVSEWLGPFGVDENFLSPVIAARDRWLEPGGIMLPERVTAWMAPAWDSELARVMTFFRRAPYGVRLGLMAEYTAHELFYVRSHIVPDDLRAEPAPMWITDAYTCSVEAAQQAHGASLSFETVESGKVNALALWFTAELATGHVLSCAPGSPPTHWSTTVCPLRRAVDVDAGTTIEVDISCEPDRPGLTLNRWSVRIGDEPWEHHDQRRALA